MRYFPCRFCHFDGKKTAFQVRCIYLGRLHVVYPNFLRNFAVLILLTIVVLRECLTSISFLIACFFDQYAGIC
jgi:hypothetical protein